MTGLDLVVGIPTRNEVATVAEVLRAIDDGVRSFLPGARCLIVNADNRSSDGTQERFASTPTTTPTRCVRTAPGVVGKGANVVDLVRVALETGARALLLVDGDVRNVAPDWIPALAAPVLEEAVDFVFPVYRTSQGGPLTNLLCRPVVEGAFGVDIAQPIGGEFVLSRRCLDRVVASPVPEHALGYGIDIFLTTESIAGRDRTAGVRLGAKRHRPRPWHTIGPIVAEVATALAGQLRRYRPAPSAGVRRPEVRGPALPAPLPAPVPDLAALTATANAELRRLERTAIDPADRELARTARRAGGLDGDGWAGVLARWSAHVPAEVARHGALLVPFFLARVLAWAGEREDPDYPGDDAVVARIARVVRGDHGASTPASGGGRA